MGDKASMNWIYDPSTGAPKEEDYLLGKAVDANFERGTLGQINAVEYGETHWPSGTSLISLSFKPEFEPTSVNINLSCLAFLSLKSYSKYYLAHGVRKHPNSTPGPL